MLKCGLQILGLSNITHRFDCTLFYAILFSFTGIITHGIGILKQFGSDLNGAASLFNDAINAQIILQGVGAAPATKKTRNFTVDVPRQARLGASYLRGGTGVSGVVSQVRREFTTITVKSKGDDAFVGQLSVCLS